MRCLHIGAIDYLLKQRLDRLVPAVKRALAEAEQRRERRAAEEASRESEERFRSLAEQSDQAFWFVNLKPEQFAFISPAAEKIWGVPIEQFYHYPRQWIVSIHDDDRTAVSQAWEACIGGQSPRFERQFRVVRPNGSACWVLCTGTPIRDAAGAIVRIGGMAKDITEQLNHQRLDRRSQRLEAIGTLASGVAHDLNNSLAPIMLGVELLKMQYPKESQILEIFETSARRGADMVRQLLSFAKGAEGERVLIRPSYLVKELETLIKGTFPKNIQLVVKCAPELRTVLGDPTQLHQVLLNLCVNARDAMPSGGMLTLEALCVEVDALYAGSMHDAKLGKYLALRVGDTGTGIPPEILDRIFDPFFTTKGPDKGTGLGLSTVMAIVKGHGGFLQVYSQPKKGSTFTAYLPTDRADSKTESLAKAVVQFHGQGKTILLVDDEPLIREMGRAVLERLNCKTLTAIDGADALIQAAQHRNELRAIITDCHMPHMDGLTFVRMVRRILPDIPVVTTSGRLDDADAKEFKTLGVTRQLDKPFTEVQLVEMLKAIL